MVSVISLKIRTFQEYYVIMMKNLKLKLFVQRKFKVQDKT